MRILIYGPTIESIHIHNTIFFPSSNFSNFSIPFLFSFFSPPLFAAPPHTPINHHPKTLRPDYSKLKPFNLPRDKQERGVPYLLSKKQTTEKKKEFGKIELWNRCRTVIMFIVIKNESPVQFLKVKISESVKFRIWIKRESPFHHEHIQLKFQFHGHASNAYLPRDRRRRRRRKKRGTETAT